MSLSCHSATGEFPLVPPMAQIDSRLADDLLRPTTTVIATVLATSDCIFLGGHPCYVWAFFGQSLLLFQLALPPYPSPSRLRHFLTSNDPDSPPLAFFNDEHYRPSLVNRLPAAASTSTCLFTFIRLPCIHLPCVHVVTCLADWSNSLEATVFSSLVPARHGPG